MSTTNQPKFDAAACCGGAAPAAPAEEAKAEGDVRSTVRERYAAFSTAQGAAACCGTAEVEEAAPSCCGGAAAEDVRSSAVGYSKEELDALPEGANLGLGCGNPLALASLKEGDTVIDLGSGGGIDCFLASKQVGESGQVIGVDMTPEMIQRARNSAAKGGYTNVEFRLGEIEALPVADATVDVVISNCVINLSPNKPRVFGEMLRALKPGGTFYVSDIVLLTELPDVIRDSAAAYAACVGGAMLKDEYLGIIEEAGFCDVKVTSETVFPIQAFSADPTVQALLEGIEEFDMLDLEKTASSIVSIKVEATKPGPECCG